MDVDDHQAAFTRSYVYDVITPLAGGRARDNSVTGQEVFTNKDSRTRLHLHCSA